MILSGFKMGSVDLVAVAVKDIIHQDPVIRDAFGGETLIGTATIDAGSTSLVGDGTNWLTKLDKGTTIILGPQVATCAAKPTSDTAVEIFTPHFLGLLMPTEIYKASNGHRLAAAGIPLGPPGMPFWAVVAGGLPDYTPGIGGIDSDPSVQVLFGYRASPRILGDTEASWSGLTQRVVALFDNSAGQTLTVPRFGMVALARGFRDVGQGQIFDLSVDEPIALPAIQLKWRGTPPLPTTDQIDPRW